MKKHRMEENTGNDIEKEKYKLIYIFRECL